MIRAFAMRTASVLGDGFFGRVGCVSAPAVGSMRNWVAAIEPCWKGCTLIGPVDVGLFLRITDNSHLSSSFDGTAPSLRGALATKQSSLVSPPAGLLRLDKVGEGANFAAARNDGSTKTYHI
jgi:hypothetical protein